MTAKKIFFIIAIVFLLQGAGAEFSLNPRTLNASIKQGLEASIQIDVSNIGENNETITVSAAPSSQDIEAVLHRNNFTLNPGESTFVSLTLMPKKNIEEGTYFVTVTAKTQEEEATETISVNVFSVNDFDFEFESQSLETCSEEGTEQINVFVQNKSSQQDEFLLFSDSLEFAPSFSPSQISVNAQSTGQTILSIPFNQTHSRTTHTIPVIATDSSGNLVEKKFYFTLAKCDSKDSFFDAFLDTEFMEISAGEQKQASLTVINLLEEKQNVFISIESLLETTKPPFEVTLSPLEERTFPITVTGREEDAAGENKVRFFIWNKNQSLERELAVEVAQEESLKVTLLNNDIKQRICSAKDLEVFEFEVENTGDIESEISVEIENPYETIGVIVPKDSTRLLPFEKRTLKAIVQPAFDTPLGEKEVVLVLRVNGRIEFEEILKFTVVEPPEEETFSRTIETQTTNKDEKTNENVPYAPQGKQPLQTPLFGEKSNQSTAILLLSQPDQYTPIILIIALGIIIMFSLFSGNKVTYRQPWLEKNPSGKGWRK